MSLQPFRRGGATRRERVARAIRIVNLPAFAKAVASAVRGRRLSRVGGPPAALAGLAALGAAGVALARRRRAAAALEPPGDSRLDETPPEAPRRGRRFQPDRESEPGPGPARAGGGGGDGAGDAPEED
jgi:hypothetical protein